MMFFSGIYYVCRNLILNFREIFCILERSQCMQSTFATTWIFFNWLEPRDWQPKKINRPFSTGRAPYSVCYSCGRIPGNLSNQFFNFTILAFLFKRTSETSCLVSETQVLPAFRILSDISCFGKSSCVNFKTV
jgi:hypothetical protein